MAEDGKKSFFTTLPGILTGIAAVLGAFTTLYFGIRDRERSQTPRDTTAEHRASGAKEADPDQDARDLSLERAKAESVASAWLTAMLNHDAAQLVALSITPFYFDQEVLVSREDIRRKYEALFVEKPAPPPGMRIASIKASTIAELKAQGQDLNRDRVVSSLSMNDSDWAVQIITEENGRREGMIMFVRRVGADLKIVGMWG